MSVHFKIIVACHNAEEWIENCLQSICIQKYDNFQAIIIDDASTDSTSRKIQSHSASQRETILSIRNDTRTCLLSNTIKGIELANPHDEDVILFVDGDDWLAHGDVLSYLNDIYSDEDVWITWGSYVPCSSGKSNFRTSYEGCKGGGWAAPIKGGVPWNPRSGWRYSHLKTCKAFLWKNIRREDFIWSKTNSHYPAATDAACMFPMLDMAGPQHCRYVKEILYVYNISNPEACNRESARGIQQQCYGEIARREKYSMMDKDQLI